MAEKEEVKKARLESLADTEKWEVAIKTRVAGASSSQAPTTTKPEALDGEKIVDDVVAEPKTQDLRA